MAEFDSVIPAGESGTLTTKVKTRPGQHGRISKGVTVTTDAEGAEALRLSFMAEVVAPIMARPANRLYLNVVEGRSASARLLLERSDGQPLEVTEVEAPADAPVKIDATPVGKDTPSMPGVEAGQGDVWIEASVTEAADPGRWGSNLTVKTNHPEMPVFQVPVHLTVRPVIEAVPGGLRMVVETGGAVRPAQVRVRHTGDEPFSIKEVVTDPTDLLVATVLSDGARPQHVIRLEVPEPKGIDSIIRGSVSVVTDGGHRVKVAVVLEDRSANAAVRRPRPLKPTPTTPRLDSGG